MRKLQAEVEEKEAKEQHIKMSNKQNMIIKDRHYYHERGNFWDKPSHFGKKQFRQFMKRKLYREEQQKKQEEEARRSKAQKAFSLKKSQIKSRKEELKKTFKKRQIESINLQYLSSQKLNENPQNLSLYSNMSQKQMRSLKQSRTPSSIFIKGGPNSWNNMASKTPKYVRSVYTPTVLQGEDEAVVNIQKRIDDKETSEIKKKDVQIKKIFEQRQHERGKRRVFSACTSPSNKNLGVSSPKKVSSKDKKNLKIALDQSSPTRKSEKESSMFGSATLSNFFTRKKKGYGTQSIDFPKSTFCQSKLSFKNETLKLLKESPNIDVIIKNIEKKGEFAGMLVRKAEKMVKTNSAYIKRLRKDSAFIDLRMQRNATQTNLRRSRENSVLFGAMDDTKNKKIMKLQVRPKVIFKSPKKKISIMEQLNNRARVFSEMDMLEQKKKKMKEEV